MEGMAPMRANPVNTERYEGWTRVASKNSMAHHQVSPL